MSELFTMIKDIAPWVAIVLSIAALVLSILNYRRDRATLQVTSTYSEGWQAYDAGIHISIVNTGRRPIILDTLVYVEYGRRRFGLRTIANSLGRFFDHENGLTLTERQKHKIWLSAPELNLNCEDEILEADDLWVTDTLHHRHKIKDIRKNVAKLRAWQAKQLPSRIMAYPP